MKKLYVSPEAEIIDLVALENIALLGSARDAGGSGGSGIIDTSGSVGDADDDEY